MRSTVIAYHKASFDTSETAELEKTGLCRKRMLHALLSYPDRLMPLTKFSHVAFFK
jgi:hypothetical protein